MNPGHILPPNPDNEGWEDHEAPVVADQVGTAVGSADDKVFINRAQDVEPILERAKSLAREGLAWSPSREMLHMAEFPAVIVEKYCTDAGITFKEFMADPAHTKRMMADPSLRDFLIWPNVTHRSYS